MRSRPAAGSLVGGEVRSCCCCWSFMLTVVHSEPPPPLHALCCASRVGPWLVRICDWLLLLLLASAPVLPIFNPHRAPRSHGQNNDEVGVEGNTRSPRWARVCRPPRPRPCGAGGPSCRRAWRCCRGCPCCPVARWRCPGSACGTCPAG